ncbi:hypothetical protein NR798_44055 [Archangium gephyra]|uniref:LVIVD repeat-containing protein n=1 Tax=Archangium gephyra TaxID=48 RepID=UPI0035D4D8DE
MNWNGLTRAALLGSLLSLAGCPKPGNTDSPDASTPEDSTGYEWDGGYVPLEEAGNWPDPVPERYSPCGFATSNAGGCDFDTFDLSACDQNSLANAGTDGPYVLSTRQEDANGAFLYRTVGALALSNDGGTSYLDGRAATESRQGNARLFSTVTTLADGGTRKFAAVTCEAPQAPGFTGCYAFCRNGRLLSRATFKSERLTRRAGEAEASGLELVSESHVDIGMPADVYVTQGHAYVVSVNHVTRTGGLTVFDVSNKAAPVKVKTVEMAGDSYWNGVWAKGNALYVASNDKGVLVFDISSPANPQLVKSLPASTRINTHTLFVDGNRLYATLATGVALFDITSPLNPLELNRYAPYDTLPHDMFAVGDRLYVNYSDQGYVVVDVSNPNDLQTLGRYDYPDQYSHASAVGTFAGRTIAFMGGEGPGEHLRVLDVTDPANIVKIGEFQLRPNLSIHNMLLVGKKLYVAWYQEGVRVLDVSNPTKPTEVAYFNTWRESDPHEADYFEGAMGIRLPGDGFIYTVDTVRGLLILREK